MGVITMAQKMLKKILVAAGLGLCFQAASYAAEPGSVASIEGADGTVMVDRGKGFVSSKAGDSLFENDRVITLEGSSAKILFSDGCAANLKSNNMMIIKADPGCKAAIVDATKTSPTAVAGTHPASYAIPVVGAYVLYEVISAAMDGIGVD